MKYKNAPVVEIKAVGDDGSAGVFEAIVSVFDNVDSYGDIVRKGAFADDLAAWASKGDPIPSYWSHRMDDPDYNIGHVLAAEETETGLKVRVQLDLENPKALTVLRLLKQRRVTQFSFAYEIQDASEVDLPDGGKAYELRKLSIYEVGPTPIGANPATELLDVKAMAERVGLKIGRTISAKNNADLTTALASMQTASELISKVLDETETEPADPAETDPPSDQTDGETGGDASKSEGVNHVKAEALTVTRATLFGQMLDLIQL